MFKKITIILLLLLCLAGCKKIDNEPEQDEEPVMNKLVAFEVNELFDTLNWIGKDVEELNIPAESYDSLNVQLSGQIFNHPATATAFYYPNTNRIEEVFIYINNIDYPMDECMAKIEEYAGSFYDQRENPYAASVGGVVSFVDYQYEDKKITFESASEYDFYTLKFKQMGSSAS